MTTITLSKSQREVYNGLDSHMEELFSRDLFISHEPRDPETARLLLELIKHVGIREDFYTTVIKHRIDGINQSLRQLLDVVRQGWGEMFFECASTHRDQYYSISTLIEMIDLFHRITPNFPRQHPPFKRFLPFDYGGKELLLDLLKNPANLIRLLKKEEPKYFAIDSSEVLYYLSSLDEKQRLPIKTYKVIFQSLQSMRLDPTEKQGIRRFLVKMTTNTRDVLAHHYSIEYLQNFLRTILVVQKYCGKETLIHFFYAPDLRNAPTLDAVLHALQYIKAWSQSSNESDELFDLLSRFHCNGIGFTQLLNTLVEKTPVVQTSMTEDPDVLRVLYKRFAGEDRNVVFPLPDPILQKVGQEYEVVQHYCKKWESLHFGDWVNLATEIFERDEKTPDDTLKLVAIGRLAIRHEFHIYLYNTQIWTVLAQLSYPRGNVAQMMTGEGKSKVTTLLAFVLSMMNSSQGHMISSSRSLSVRDQKEHYHFFKAFGIETSHICEDHRDADHFQARILYGTATDFEFAVMRQMLFFEKLFPIEAFDWVIVDEIDNLTIDTALNGARLSYKAEITYDWVYVPIFSFVQGHFPIKDISNNMLDDLRCHLKEYMEGKFSRYVEHFSDRKLKGWIQAACKALEYKEKENYIVGIQDSMYGKKTKSILIVDAENTGRIQHGSRWSGGVHEFVEVKHGLEVARESICPISMSHPVFYPMYKSLFGITGTIGSRFEREEMKAIYQVDSFDVPTHHPSQREDTSAIVLPTDVECNEYHVQVIQRCKQAGRPTLVLCRSIKETEVLGRLLESARIPFEMLNEIQKKPEQAIIHKAGLPGAVTVATNTAGRGTDIRLSEESLRNGGLHVLITFHPESDRVELQARGRAGRQGQPGSSEIVISAEPFNMDPAQVLAHLTHLRQQRVISQKNKHITYAKIERSAFEMTREFYQMLETFHELTVKDSFLNRLSILLESKKFLQQEERDFSHLSFKNRQIGEMVLQLLNSSKDETMRWKILIQQIVQRMKDHVINDFALNFRPIVSEATRDLDFASHVADQIKEDFSFHAESALQAFLETTQEELRNSFVQQKQMWESYLDFPDRGILKYLKDQFNIDLKLRKFKGALRD